MFVNPPCNEWPEQGLTSSVLSIQTQQLTGQLPNVQGGGEGALSGVFGWEGSWTLSGRWPEGEEEAGCVSYKCALFLGLCGLSGLPSSLLLLRIKLLKCAHLFLRSPLLLLIPVPSECFAAAGAPAPHRVPQLLDQCCPTEIERKPHHHSMYVRCICLFS